VTVSGFASVPGAEVVAVSDGETLLHPAIDNTIAKTIISVSIFFIIITPYYIMY
jgi:hypothetical protein